MFPIDTGLQSQPNHSLLDVLLRLWTLICLFKPHKYDKFYLKKLRFSRSLFPLAAVAGPTCICSELRGDCTVEIWLILRCYSWITHILCPKFIGHRLSTHAPKGEGNSSSTCAEHFGGEFLETLGKAQQPVSITCFLSESWVRADAKRAYWSQKWVVC